MNPPNFFVILVLVIIIAVLFFCIGGASLCLAYQLPRRHFNLEPIHLGINRLGIVGPKLNILGLDCITHRSSSKSR